MMRTWLSIRVDLVEGRGERLWPRPGATAPGLEDPLANGERYACPSARRTSTS